MAKNSIEEVKYIFTSEVDNLMQGVNKVLGALGKVENSYKNLGKTEDTQFSGKGATRMRKSLSQLSSEIRRVFTQMGSLKIENTFIKASIAVGTLAGAINTKIGKIKDGIFDSIINKIKSMEFTSDSVSKNISKHFESVVSAFRRASKSADDSGNSANRSAKKTKTLQEVLKSIKTQSDKTGSSFDSLHSKANKLSNTFDTLAGRGNTLKTVFAALTGYRLGSFFADGIREAVNFAEVLNMFNVAMRDSIDAGEEFVNQMSELYSLDPKTLMKHTSMFYQLASAVETPAESARQMSMGLTQLSVDLASLFDMDINQVAENLSSGMMGMTRAVRKYGIDIRNTTLQQEALNLGLNLNVSTTSEANRQGLRYLVMMKQAAIVTGDFGKTLSSPANQLRILKEQTMQLARAIGTFFLPVLQKVLPVLNGFIMALRTILNFFARLLGIAVPSFGGATDAAKELGTAAGNAAGNVGDIGSQAKKAAKDMKNLVAPFDELNILNADTDSDTGSSAGGGGDAGGIGGELMDPALAAAIADMERSLEQVENKANEVRDSILDFLGFEYQDVFNPDTGEYEQQLVWLSDKFQKNLVDKFPQWKKTIDATFENWDAIIASVVNLGSVLWETFGTILSPIKLLWQTLFADVNWDQAVADFITALPERLNAISAWIEQNQGLIAALVYTISSIALGFKAWSVIQTILPILQALGTAFSVLSTFLNPVTIAIGALVAIFAYAYTQFESVRNAVTSLKDSFVLMASTVGELMQTVWDSVLEPIFTNLKNTITELWENHLKNLIEQFALLATSIGEAVTTIITILAKLVTYVVSHVGPPVTQIFNAIISIIGTLLGTVTDVIAGVMKVLRGLITFITGVFQGDWSKAWEGIKTIFGGIWDTLVGVVKGVINLIIDLINGLLGAVWTAIADIVNGVSELGNKVLDFIGIDVELGMPTPPPKIPHLATGGVVSSPTMALIGEGKYSEAVIPLDNSPQMKQLVKDIVEGLNGDPFNSNTEPIYLDVHVNLDGTEIYRNQQRVERKLGKDFGMGGFQR